MNKQARGESLIKMLRELIGLASKQTAKSVETAAGGGSKALSDVDAPDVSGEDVVKLKDVMKAKVASAGPEYIQGFAAKCASRGVAPRSIL